LHVPEAMHRPASGGAPARAAGAASADDDIPF
jgi:hypothetical protein